jgi:hypothetical protein
MQATRIASQTSLRRQSCVASQKEKVSASLPINGNDENRRSRRLLFKLFLRGLFPAADTIFRFAD